jgi:hypothetical protein
LDGTKNYRDSIKLLVLIVNQFNPSIAILILGPDPKGFAHNGYPKAASLA